MSDSSSDYQIIAGIVDSEGDVIGAYGDFTADYQTVDVDDSFTGENIKGTYSVQYGSGNMGSTTTSPFTKTPIVLVTPNYNQSDPTSIHTRIAALQFSDNDGFVVSITNHSNNPEECQFNFIAVGI